MGREVFRILRVTGQCSACADAPFSFRQFSASELGPPPAQVSGEAVREVPSLLGGVRRGRLKKARPADGEDAAGGGRGHTSGWWL